MFGLSPEQLHDMTFDFKEIVIDFLFPSIQEFKDEENRTETIIHYKKTISLFKICYHFKYSNVKPKTGKNEMVYNLNLYHHDKSENPYYLYLSSNIDYKINRAKSLEIFGN